MTSKIKLLEIDKAIDSLNNYVDTISPLTSLSKKQLDFLSPSLKNINPIYKEIFSDGVPSTEGILGTIWDKLKALVNWLVDKIKALFSIFSKKSKNTEDRSKQVKDKLETLKETSDKITTDNIKNIKDKNNHIFLPSDKTIEDVFTKEPHAYIDPSSFKVVGIYNFEIIYKVFDDLHGLISMNSKVSPLTTLVNIENSIKEHVKEFKNKNISKEEFKEKVFKDVKIDNGLLEDVRAFGAHENKFFSTKSGNDGVVIEVFKIQDVKEFFIHDSVLHIEEIKSHFYDRTIIEKLYQFEQILLGDFKDAKEVLDEMSKIVNKGQTEYDEETSKVVVSIYSSFIKSIQQILSIINKLITIKENIFNLYERNIKNFENLCTNIKKEINLI